MHIARGMRSKIRAEPPPAMVARRGFASGRVKAAACALLIAAPVTLAGFALPSRAVFAQEKIAVATRVSTPGAATDQARLAALGTGEAAIEQCDDVELLWRAVRELVLPQRVSERMQQRILRRIWVLDPDIAKGSLLESENH
jgi:hypothetical protein